jgi:hypothetical protein
VKHAEFAFPGPLRKAASVEEPQRLSGTVESRFTISERIG